MVEIVDIDARDIKAYIERSGFKQKAVAEKSGLNEFKLCMSLQGKRKLEAREYEVRIDERFYTLGGEKAGYDRSQFLCYEVKSFENHRVGNKARFLGLETKTFSGCRCLEPCQRAAMRRCS